MPFPLIPPVRDDVPHIWPAGWTREPPAVRARQQVKSETAVQRRGVPGDLSLRVAQIDDLTPAERGHHGDEIGVRRPQAEPAQVGGIERRHIDMGDEGMNLPNIALAVAEELLVHLLAGP